MSDAHKMFLDFSSQLQASFARTSALQAQLLEAEILDEISSGDLRSEGFDPEPNSAEPAFSRKKCMEFATGSVADVLGPEFAVIDTCKTRVRLPDEPLMLVDRILVVEGEKMSLGPGRVVTEHDVKPGAWYLDGDRAPACISIEAGQADLFLCSYLGIDHAVMGERVYRLLDATVEFYRGLPRPGDVIRYEIEIERFAKQNETFLFFFSFNGFIGDTRLISMSNGCAGFFTEEEVINSGGIILTEKETASVAGKKLPNWEKLVPVSVESYTDEAVNLLRKGDLAGCFGPFFKGINIAKPLMLPGNRMKLIDRILQIDPAGGRFGLGLIRAQADISPDDWFLTCHFMDDMVMPGTLMYECCAHTLRVFFQRIGWITDKQDVCYEPVAGIKSILKCRGPVTPETRQVVYEVEINEIGYRPEPYAVADAHIFADGHRIVLFKNMSMQLTGITKKEIESFWESRRENGSGKLSAHEKKPITSPVSAPVVTPVFDRAKLLAFAVGNPSEAFGQPYKAFDKKRFIARLPGPPYLFMDRVTHVEPIQWELKPGGWIESEYDLSSDKWYFNADFSKSMPLCILLEIALQPCGWLAAYMGSALKSSKDLRFRNLGGNAVWFREVLSDPKTLVTRARLTQASETEDMIIERFDMQVLHNNQMIYKGDTTFGFFSKASLRQQTGIRMAKTDAYKPAPDELQRGRSHIFKDKPPLSPNDLCDLGDLGDLDNFASCASMPAKAIRMIDRIDVFVPDGGPAGLGFIRGVKDVDPKEWFFTAHFYQDPVCPGSLGIESFIQLLKFVAIDRWGHPDQHPAKSYRFAPAIETEHTWTYRGQIIPENKKIETEAVITKIEDLPVPAIYADGFLKVDGLYIYQMKNFGIRLIPGKC